MICENERKEREVGSGDNYPKKCSIPQRNKPLEITNK